MCMLVYMFTLVVGNFLVMNLFLAMLLNKFGREDLVQIQKASHSSTKKKNRFFVCVSRWNQRNKQKLAERKKRGCCLKCQEACKCSRMDKCRDRLRRVVEHNAFEYSILLVIVWSTFTLTLDDKYYEVPKNRRWREPLIDYTSLCLAVIFTVEFVMRLVALGPRKYFLNGWNLIDFVIMLATLVDVILLEEKYRLRRAGEDETRVTRTTTVTDLLRILRAVRPLRAVQQWENTRIVVDSFIKSIPSIFNVLLVCIVFWLIFAIAGVNLMKGRFAACYYVTTEQQVPKSTPDFPVINKAICDENPQFFIWRNFPINFDNTGNALLALFQVALFEGWMEVMQRAVDMPENYEEQPSRENSLAYYFFFFAFIICGSFFTLNLFIGVIIDNFNSVKERISHDSYKDKAFSDNQAKFLKTMKRVVRQKPKAKVVAPKFLLGKLCHAIVHKLSFDLIVPVVITLDIIVQSLRRFEMNEPEWLIVLNVILFHFNIMFTGFYLWEFVIRVVALNKHIGPEVYVIDLLSLVVSIIGIILKLSYVTDMDFAFIRALRIYRIGRAFKQFKFSSATRIRKLLLAFLKSGSSLLNIMMLMAIFLIIYALIGMKLFQDVRHQKFINDRVNFETFQSSIYLLFRLMTAGGWNDVLDSVTSPSYENICTKGKRCTSNGVAYVFFVTFLLIVFLIIVNMYVAVLLKYFDLADDQEQIGVTEDDYELFLGHWQNSDPKGCQFINHSDLSNFVAHVKGPLQMRIPNALKLINLSIPLTFQDKVHVVHVFEALLAHYLRPLDQEASAFISALQERHESLKSIFPNFDPTFPCNYTTKTRDKAGQAYTVLQRAYINNKFLRCLRSMSNAKYSAKIRNEIENAMLL
ncbi:sodium channel protein 1 brain-like [Convolutriloba macropyga]|uniref:sodium channel protein 1 brain-like n=1 Tax=Convolutriloba macropyga TaxID=536237 RepID=UPI003F521916